MNQKATDLHDEFEIDHQVFSAHFQRLICWRVYLHVSFVDFFFRHMFLPHLVQLWVPVLLPFLGLKKQRRFCPTEYLGCLQQDRDVPL